MLNISTDGDSPLLWVPDPVFVIPVTEGSWISQTREISETDLCPDYVVHIVYLLYRQVDILHSRTALMVERGLEYLIF